jgi:hypothetical protein
VHVDVQVVMVSIQGLSAPTRLTPRLTRVATSQRQTALRATDEQVTGLVFEPFQAVRDDLAVVEGTPSSMSFARVGFAPECEAAINEQINIEYTISYVYHSLYAYFDRDNVGLPGFAAFFKSASEEERGHAELLMEYQNKRGGKVKLQVRFWDCPRSLRVQCLALLCTRLGQPSYSPPPLKCSATSCDTVLVG